MKNKVKIEKTGGTVIVSCTCKSEYQDRIYGKGKRLANTSFDRKKGKCVVCSEIINFNL